jgi:hypothetical protein
MKSFNTKKRKDLAAENFDAEPQKGPHPAKGTRSSSELITGEGRKNQN